MHAAPRVLIVEDQTMMAQSLALALGGDGVACRLADLSSAGSILAGAEAFAPDLVLLDLHLAGIDGLDLIEPLVAAGTRVLVISGSRDEARLAAALTLGAAGYLRKSQPFEDLLHGVMDAVADRPLLDEERLAELIAVGETRLTLERDLRARFERLTPRETEVLDAIASGRTVQEIAGELYLTVATVRSHVRAILAKLGVTTQLAAAAAARQRSAV